MALVTLKKVSLNGTRFYQVGDDKCKLYPSVTTVLSGVLAKPGLDSWQRKVSLLDFKSQLKSAASTHRLTDVGDVKILPSDQTMMNILLDSMLAPDKVLEKSQIFGTGAHSIIENLIITGQDDVNCDEEYRTVKDAFRAWRDHVKTSGSNISKTEIEVFSKTYGYAGTMDAILESTDEETGQMVLTAIDWKTSNFIRNEYGLQVAAYAKAYEEMTNLKIHRAAVVRFNKKGTPSYEVKVVQELDDAFDAFCSLLHVWQTMKRSLF